MSPDQPKLLCTGHVLKSDDSGNGSIKVASPLIAGELKVIAGANTARSVIDKAEDGQEIELFYRLKSSAQKRASKKQMHK